MNYITGRAINCLYDSYQQPLAHEKFETIRAFNYNTKEHVEAELKLDQALSDTNWRATEEGCDETFVK